MRVDPLLFLPILQQYPDPIRERVQDVMKDEHPDALHAHLLSLAEALTKFFAGVVANEYKRSEPRDRRIEQRLFTVATKGAGFGDWVGLLRDCLAIYPQSVINLALDRPFEDESVIWFTNDVQRIMQLLKDGVSPQAIHVSMIRRDTPRKCSLGSFLNAVVELRNAGAHPDRNIQLPDGKQVDVRWNPNADLLTSLNESLEHALYEILKTSDFLRRYRLGTIEEISLAESEQFVHKVLLQFGGVQLRRTVVHFERLGTKGKSYLFDERDLPYVRFDFGRIPDPDPAFVEEFRVERKVNAPAPRPGESIELIRGMIELFLANDGVIDVDELARLQVLGKQLGLPAGEVERQIQARRTPAPVTAPAPVSVNLRSGSIAPAESASPGAATPSTTTPVAVPPLAGTEIAGSATDAPDAQAWQSEATDFLARVRTLVQNEGLPFTPVDVTDDAGIGADLPRWASVSWSTSPVHYFGVAVGKKWRNLLTLTFGFYSLRKSKDPLFRQAIDLLEQDPALAPEGECVIAGRRFRWDDSEHLGFDSPIRVTVEMLKVPELRANTAKDFVDFITRVWPVIAPIEASAAADTRWRDAALKAHETRRRLAEAAQRPAEPEPDGTLGEPEDASGSGAR